MSVSEPGKIITPWAESGLKNPIPPAANPATGRAGFDQGFSAINMTAKEAGGIPPFGQDFNGIFYEVTNILRYMQAGGQPTFDAALATAIGGYPKGAMVLGSDGLTLWQSKVDSNTDDPNIDPIKWGTFDIGLKADLIAPGGAGIIGTLNGETVQANLDGIIGEAETSLRKLYRYKLLKTLPLSPALVSSVVSAEGYLYLYPQAFSYGKNGDVFVNFSSNDQIATWVVKYNSSGIAVSIFKAYDGLSEVSNFYSVGSTDFYVVGGKGTLRVFNVTSLPAGESAQSPVDVKSPDVYFGGCKFDDNRMLLEEWETPLGTITRRNRLFVYNLSTGLREQAVTLPLPIVGFASGSEYDPITHKTQGFAATGIGVYLSHGRLSTGTETDVSNATGVSLMTWQGDTAGTALVTSSAMRQFLIENGLSPTRIENEGVTIGDGGFANVLHVYLASDEPGATSGGIAISSVGEPFGYKDLSQGALAPLTATYYGKSRDGLKNPYTGETMDTMAKIFDYMVATDCQEYWFYTNTATVSDLDGSAFPGSTMVRIYNQNNTTFFYETINAGVQTWWFSGTPYSKNYMSWSGTGEALDLTNTISGSAAGRNITGGAGGNGNTVYGHLSGEKLTDGKGNTFIGQNSGREMTTGNNSTHSGRNAGRFQIDGVTPNNFDFCSTIGYNAFVSGDSQVQLGGAGTTTYVYGTVQNRSDANDKTDIRDTQLGIDFIMGLRPVDGRWDMRDDYLEEIPVYSGVGDDGQELIDSVLIQTPKDGSKARTRFHHWFIAQEVKELCDKLGVDFGGYQDHSINGGADVKTLGYDEFIPPTVKAVQQCWTRLDELEKRIAKLE